MIGRLEITNWGPFRGTHRLELGPGAYAITARHESDARRSNAVGKSMLLEAIDYALTGRLNKNRGFDVDGWITRGEREGSVKLTLDNGASIVRSKKRGQSRQVRVSLPGRGEAAQDPAHHAFLKHVGFDEDDFRRASYFEQKEAARLLRTDPEVRLSVVSSWLGLSLADRAEDRGGQIVGERWGKVRLLEERKKILEYRLAPIESEAEIEKKREDADKLRVIVARLERELEEARAADHAREFLAAHDALVEEGKKLRKWVDDNTRSIEKESKLAADALAVSNGEAAEASAELRKCRVVMDGKFDGQCPIGGFECPVADRINQDRTAAMILYKKAKARHDAASGAEMKARGRDLRAREGAGILASNTRRLEHLRGEVKKNLSRVEGSKKLVEQKGDVDADGIRSEIAGARQRLAEHEAALLAHERARTIAKENDEELEAIRADLDKAIGEHKIAHVAREIFRSARRRVAERALGEIEEDTNDAIARAGVDLTLNVQWEREGKKLAIECSECGAPFPVSARVKECARCAAPRGMHTIPRLDFVLSDSSGGYDDLAGVALQLSAGAWLLRARQSPWSTAILDEPSAALDKRVREGLVRYLAGVTSRGRYRQMLVVSHSDDVLDAIPNRITIIRKSSGDREIVS